MKFTAGETIQGWIIYNLDPTLKISNLELKINCLESVKFNKNEAINIATCLEKKVVDANRSLANCSDLSASFVSQKIPFEIKLPNLLPSSLLSINDSEQISISYNLEASIEVSP